MSDDAAGPDDEDWLHAPRKGGDGGEPFTVTRWLKSNAIILLVFVGTVLYQTRMFGYYSPEAIRARVKAAAEEHMKFGTWEKRVLKTGDGAAVERGKWVTAHMMGWTEEGNQFWNTKVDRAPFGFVAGKGRILRGLDEAVMEMRQGDRVRVTLAPDVAFGERGKKSWRIEPWAVLTFEVEVVGMVDEEPKQEKKKKEAQPPQRPVEDQYAPAGEDEDEEEELLEPLTREVAGDAPRQAAKGGDKTQQPAPAPPPTADPAVQPDLLAELRQLSLEKFAAPLGSVGLVSVDDLRLIESADELPADLPLFSRKKLVGHARKLRELSAAGGGAPPPGGGAAAGGGGQETVPADAAPADGSGERCRKGDPGCGGGAAA